MGTVNHAKRMNKLGKETIRSNVFEGVGYFMRLLCKVKGVGN
jgi:hypothetical protein